MARRKHRFTRKQWVVLLMLSIETHTAKSKVTVDVQIYMTCGIFGAQLQVYRYPPSGLTKKVLLNSEPAHILTDLRQKHRQPAQLADHRKASLSLRQQAVDQKGAAAGWPKAVLKKQNIQTIARKGIHLTSDHFAQKVATCLTETFMQQ